MAAIRRHSDRTNPWLALIVVALGLAVAFMGWTLWSSSRQVVEGAVVALDDVRPPASPLPEPRPR
jgi:hypothetical protein